MDDEKELYIMHETSQPELVVRIYSTSHLNATRKTLCLCPSQSRAHRHVDFDICLSIRNW